ncbi:energy-coupling factor transporter transmembrane component T family protein [Rhizobium helianthi]|uniref:Energy-coupling factor transporter transmembrane component T family protein n=1 Tax=Rhizobium helianthi TaxID=1132695 RepID=A0ABW4M660_9HYPH
MTSLHMEGNSWLHRASAGYKLFSLFILSLVLSLLNSPALLGLSLFAAILLAAQVGLTPRPLWARTKPVLLTIALLALVNYVVVSPRDALVTLLRLPAIVVLATIVTATTSLSAFIDCLTKAARPLERLGLLRAADVGLALGLVLRFVPEIAARHETLRAAHKARGIPYRLHRALGPLIIATLKDADSIAEAIDARGIRGHKSGHSK